MYITYYFSQIQYRIDILIEHCIFAVAFFLPLSLDIATIFLAVGSLLWVGKMCIAGRLDICRTPFDILIIALIGLSAASIFVSPDRSYSFYNFYHLMGRYILFYYIVINHIHSLCQLKKLISLVMFSAVIVATYGFYQYLSGIDISAFAWVDAEQFPELKVRVFSTMQNPNLLAGFLVMIMAITAGLGVSSDKPASKVLFFCLTAFLGACLILTFSRGAWLSLIVVLGVYGILYKRKLLWLLLVLPAYGCLGHDVVLERLMSILNPTDTSSAMRLALWESTVAMILDSPFLGVGWGAYWLVYPKYDFFVQNPDTTIFHAHNMYLHIAAETGIPGLMAFMAVMYRHARTACTIMATTNDNWVAGLMLGVTAAVMGIAAGGLTDYIMFNTQMAMMFWLLNAAIVVVLQLRRE